MDHRHRLPTKGEHIHARFGNGVKVFSLGAPCAGKGQTGAHLVKTYGESPENGFWTVTVGDLVSARIKADEQFRTMHAEAIADRDLLPNEVIRPMMLARYHKGIELGYKNFYIDGDGRNAGQIDELVELDLLNQTNSLCFIFEVDFAVCKLRLEHALRTGDRNHRTDNGKLRKGFDIFTKNIESVRAALLRHRIDHEPIDANRELDEVKENVLMCVMRARPIPV
jgi:adenylate kinase family enzyme